VAALALLVQGLFALLQRALTPRGLKVQAARAGGRAPTEVGVADAERVTAVEAGLA